MTTADKKLKILVFGGGGKVARHLARLGTEAGHEVISVVRNEDQCVYPSMKSSCCPYLWIEGRALYSDSSEG
jgi:nucleoside-diphosphate-sugar epimerase